MNGLEDVLAVNHPHRFDQIRDNAGVVRYDPDQVAGLKQGFSIHANGRVLLRQTLDHQHVIGTAGPRVVPAERGSPRARARRERGAPSSVSRRESARARANDAARAPARPASAPQPATRALPDVHELMVPYEDLRGP